MAIYILSGALLLGVIWHFVRSSQQKTHLRQLEHEAQDQATSTALSQERIEQLSKQNEHDKSLLDIANAKVQESAVELAKLRQDSEHKTVTIQKNTQLIDKLEQQLEALRQQDKQQQNTLIKLQTEHEQMLQTNTEKLALLEDAKTKLALEFKELANRIFDEKQSKMTASSKETLQNVIEPMQKNMDAFRERIDKVHEEDIKARSSLERHLEHLQTLNQKMSQEALNLTHALKGDSKAQGNWGEMILERLLESSGLREGHEFEREKSFENHEGKRQRPDVIVNMPDQKQVIIDSKVSLTDYERAVSANDESARALAIRAHVKSMQQHIQALATKRYDQLHGINSPEYTLMFVPIESAYLMAVEADSSIFENAFHQRVAVVTPSTLYATLKLIEQLWRYEKQGDNVVKLTEQAGRLHDKFVGFLESFEEINRHIGSAQKSYDTALGQLKDGKGNLVNRVKTLADLSGKAKKEIPKHLLNETSSNNIEQESEGQS